MQGKNDLDAPTPGEKPDEGGEKAEPPEENASAQQVEPEPPETDPVQRLQEEKAQIREKMLRIAAEFENYKKRTQRDIRDREERAKADVIKLVLPTIDNLRRAVEHAEKASDMATIVDGIGMAEKNFLETLGKLGVTRVEALGQVFDPASHEAIAQQPSEDVPAGVILHEVHAGYVLGDKLLRPALVVVSSGKPKPSRPQEETGGEGAEPSPGEQGQGEAN
jgi:molecular chaperone GrpE